MWLLATTKVVQRCGQHEVLGVAPAESRALRPEIWNDEGCELRPSPHSSGGLVLRAMSRRDRDMRCNSKRQSSALSLPRGRGCSGSMDCPRHFSASVATFANQTSPSSDVRLRVVPLHTHVPAFICSSVAQLVSRLTLDSADIGLDGGSRNAAAAAAAAGVEVQATCCAPCPISGRRRHTPTTTATPTTPPSGRPGALATPAPQTDSSASSTARVVVGFADGSIACASMPRPTAPYFSLSSKINSGGDGGVGSRHCGEEQGGASVVRRLRRTDAGGEGGGVGGHGPGGPAIGAAITAICSLSTALLVVAGDSDGRLGLWTTSAALPSGGRRVPHGNQPLVRTKAKRQCGYSITRQTFLVFHH